jgi:hypothetical protein
LALSAVLVLPSTPSALVSSAGRQVNLPSDDWVYSDETLYSPVKKVLF